MKTDYDMTLTNPVNPVDSNMNNIVRSADLSDCYTIADVKTIRASYNAAPLGSIVSR